MDDYNSPVIFLGTVEHSLQEWSARAIFRPMWIRRSRPSWELPETSATPEHIYRDRRRLLKAAGLGLSLMAAGKLTASSVGLPAERNPRFVGADLDLTDEELVTGYNNFFEFGSDKGDPKRNAHRLKTEPWTIEIGGLVRNPLKIDVSDLIRKVGGLEQRVYRFRCVEAWSMVIPWDGFPLATLLKMVEPKAEARYVRFETFYDPEVAVGQRRMTHIDWPYVEGLRLDEAMHPLTLMATGLYGKPMPNQNGAPIRLVVPWKYGFKSIKSIVRIDLVERQPLNTWQALQPQEYGFFANVNPEVGHPRWSQASERIIGGGLFRSRQRTLMFNGYDEVASLYQGMDLRKHF